MKIIYFDVVDTDDPSLMPGLDICTIVPTNNKQKYFAIQKILFHEKNGYIEAENCIKMKGKFYERKDSNKN